VLPRRSKGRKKRKKPSRKRKLKLSVKEQNLSVFRSQKRLLNSTRD